MKKLPYYDQLEKPDELEIMEPASYWREYKHYIHKVGKEAAYPRRSGRTYKDLIALIRWCYLTNQDGYYFVYGNNFAHTLSNKVVPEIVKALGLGEEVEYKTKSSIYLYKKFLTKPSKALILTVLPVFSPIVGVREGVYSLDHYFYDAKMQDCELDRRVLDYLAEIKARLSPV